MKSGCVPDEREQDVVSAGRLNRAPSGWVLWWEAEWNHVAREGGESEARHARGSGDRVHFADLISLDFGGH